MTLSQTVNTATRRVPVWAVYITCGLPVFGLIYGLFFGGLGVDPIRTLEHELGQWGLRLIIAGLCVTPLRRWAGINLIRFRRALGVMAFVYIALHLVVWLGLDMGLRADLIWKDILKRPYITIGMAGFVLMTPLAATSNNWSVRRLGSVVWGRLHKLVYPTALAGAVHFLMVVKAWPPEPIIYLGIVASLLALRTIPKQRRAVA